MKYLTNCVKASADDLEIMIDEATEITYSELLEYVNQDALLEVFPFYRECQPSLTLKTDWAVSYYKSTFRGDPCVFVDHSRIEYIFT